MSTAVVSRVRRLFEGPARQNAFGSLLIQGSQRLFRFVVVIAAAAILTPASFAAVAVALALADLVRGGLQAFDVGAVRLLAAGDDAPGVVRASLDGKSLAGLAGLSLAVALAVLMDDAETAWLVVIAGAGSLAASFASSFLVQRQAALDLRSISARVTWASLVGAALSVILLALTGSALGVVAGLALGDALLLVLVCGGYRWRRPDWQAAIALIDRSRSLLVMQLAYIGQFRVGTIVLAAAGSTIAVGEYTIASRIAEGLVILAVALTASSLPLIGAAHARNERAGLTAVFERSYGLGMAIVTPLLAGLVIAAPMWIATLFSRYPGAGPISGIVGLAVMIFFASSQTTALLNATHHDRAASRSAVAGLAASVIGSISLVSFGAVGVAWARVAGELVRLVVEAVAGITEVGIRPAVLARPWLKVLPVLIGAAIAVVANWQPPYVWAAVLVGLAGTILLVVPAFRDASRRPA